MRRVMKYIKPETTVVKADGVVLLSVSPIEEGILDPSKKKGTDNGDGNIVMSKHNPFDIEDFDDTGWKTNDYGAW